MDEQELSTAPLDAFSSGVADMASRIDVAIEARMDREYWTVRSELYLYNVRSYDRRGGLAPAFVSICQGSRREAELISNETFSLFAIVN